jgi:hypothetical protein
LYREKAFGLEKQRQDAEYGEKNLAERRVAAQEGNLEVGRGNLKVAQGQLGMAEQSDEVKWARSLQLNVRPMTKALFTKITKQTPETGVLINPLLDDLDAGEIKTREQLRNRLFQIKASPEVAGVRESLRNKAAKLLEQGKKREAAVAMATYEMFDTDNMEDLIDNAMGKPMSLRRTAQARGLGKGGKQDRAYQDKVWDPKTQSWMQQDDQGKWSKIAQSPSKAQRRVVYGADGQPVLVEGDVDLHKLPASQVEKIGNLDTAIGNLDRMRELVKSGKDGGRDMTGMLEWGNKMVDNWNLLGKQDRSRAELRQRVAMSLKFMYDVMGRQLAVQELKKGEAMLPDMKVDENVFLDRVNNLQDYMRSMLLANYEAFKAAGYDIPSPTNLAASIDRSSDGFRDAIDAHGEALAAQYKAQGMSEADITVRVMEDVRRKFMIGGN